MEGNEEIFTKLMNDDKMMAGAAQQVGKDVYNKGAKVARDSDKDTGS